MSHFACLVIGDNAEHQLSPFHEFECTGIDDEFVVDIDITKEALEAVAKGESLINALGNWMEEGCITPSDRPLRLDGIHKYAYAIVDDGVLKKAVNRTNPNKKWDWWTTDGRFQTCLMDPSGATIIRGKLSDISLDKMREREESNRGTAWDEMRKAAGNNTAWETWKSCMEKHGPTEVAREAYNTQSAIRAMRVVKPWMNNLDQFLSPRAEYVAQSKYLPLAVVHERTWHQAAEMGWWGATSDEKSLANWAAEFNDIIAKAGPDARFTLVDCHI